MHDDIENTSIYQVIKYKLASQTFEEPQHLIEMQMPANVL